MKEHLLHTDLRRGDRLFYFTTCGWMMWNWLVSGLASGATLVLYDGSPTWPDAGALWRMAAEEGITIFGTSAKYLAANAKANLHPVWISICTLCARCFPPVRRWRRKVLTTCISA